MCSGEALSYSLQERFFARMGAELENLYGPTEAAIDVTYWSCEREGEQREVPIGRPIANTRVYVLDEGQRPVAVGVVGELYLGGEGLARGYLNRPDTTAERFLPDPFSTEGGARIYRTGDRARYLPDGNLVYVGRADNQVKLRGMRIELGEIEEALGAHPLVRACAVLVTGEAQADRRLVAYFSAADGGELSAGELRAYLSERLPSYMLPARFVRVAELPLTASGKIDRRALLSREQSAETGSEGYVAPRTEMEEVVAGIWGEVLQVERVGVEDDFFAVGGHSLLATQVMSRVREATRVELPLRLLFECPTVESLARRIEAKLRAGEKNSMPALRPAPRTDATAPVSFAQQRLWFLDQLRPGGSEYNLASALRLKGSLDVEALERCVDELVRRHESLRTTFKSVEGEAVQIIAPHASVWLSPADLSHLPEDEREAVAMRRAREEAVRHFDLEKEPLARALLIQLAETEHILLFTMHHIISDGWSMGVLVRECSALYEAYSAGKPSPLAELPVQYADYAIWQREWLTGDALETQLSYWRDQLAGAPPSLELPTDFTRLDIQTTEGATQAIVLSGELVAALKTLSRREGATLFMTLLAAFNVLLYRYTGQDDILVGTPVGGRRDVRLESLIGFFVNTLTLRTDISGEPTFSELLARVREVCLNAYAHQDVPFEKLVEELQPARSLNRTPLFQVMFALQNTPQQELSLPGLKLETLDVENATTKFDLSFSAMESDGQLFCVLRYKTALFEAATIARMLRHFEMLLTNAVERPNERITSLPIMEQAEERRMLYGWNETGRDYPKGLCLHELFERQAARTPNAEAIRFEDETLTYEELNRSADMLARRLRAAGVGAETLVGLLAERTPRMITGLLAVLKAGGAYLPLDPNWPKERLALVLSDARVPVLLTEERFAGRLPEHTASLMLLDGAEHPVSSSADDAPAAAQVRLENPAYVIYTSGSTGQPKGVVIEHRQILNYAQAIAERVGFEPGASFAMVQPLTVDSSQTVIFPALCLGGTLHLISRERATDVAALGQYFTQHTIDCLKIAPSHLAALQTSEHPETLLPRRSLIIGGEASRREWVEELQRLAPGCTIFNHYGPTEATVGMLTYRLGESASQSKKRVLPMGLPLANTTAYVLDNNFCPVPTGVSGELYIGGACVARGYLNQPQLTAERFIPDPFSSEPGLRLYKTGDIVRRLADGNLLFIGRGDQQVKIRGFRIELGEIETALRQHESVRDVAIVVREEAHGDRRLVGYVVLQATAGQLQDNVTAELRSYLKERLPDYMIPSALVVLERLPLSSHGKLELRKLPAPEPSRTTDGSDYIAPRDETERRLAEIWGDLLGIEDIGIHGNFFELGGHSLLATQVISRIQKAFNANVPLRTLFESPTVAELARRIVELQSTDELARVAPPPIEKFSRDGDLPLSFAQQRLWILHQLEPDSFAYNNVMALRLRGHLNVSALEQSFEALIARHEILRTIFPASDGIPTQVILPPQPFNLGVLDLSDAPVEEREREAADFVGEEARKPFDLARAPLFKVQLLRLAEREYVLLLTMHHIISDGWSMSIMIRELTVLYDAFSRQRRAQLPEVKIQYADFAAWQRNWLQGETLEKYVSYWKEKLDGARPLLELPTDFPRTSVRTSRGSTEEIVLPYETADAVKHFGRDHNVTPFIVMLSALNIALNRWTKQGDMVIGTVTANRNHLETERLLGCLMNFLPLRARVSEEASGLELLRQLKATVLEAHHYQDCPFEKVVEVINPERAKNRNPLYNVAFLMQNFPTSEISGGHLELAPFHVERQASMLDMTFVAEERDDGLHLKCEYDADLFTVETIKSFNAFYIEVLRQFVEQPQKPLSGYELPEKLAVEREQAAAAVESDRLRITINSTFPTEPVSDTLSYWMDALDIDATVEFAAPSRTFEQLVQLPHPAGASAYAPVNVVLVALDSWLDSAPDISTASERELADIIEVKTDEFARILKKAAAASAMKLLLFICPASPTAIMAAGGTLIFERFEEKLAGKLSTLSNIHVTTTTSLAVLYPVSQTHEQETTPHARSSYSPAFFAALGTMIARRASALIRQPYSVVVLDCAATLLESGNTESDNVEVNLQSAELQRFLLTRRDAGMSICLYSRTAHEDILRSTLEQHAAIQLKPSAVTSSRFESSPPSLVLYSLAEELKLDIEGFIFLSADFAACEEAQENCPQALSLQLPGEPDEVSNFLAHVWEFDSL
ncbi:MAG TPA: amino acid adenylation domain-containing protein [Pyrinomonadaceae bacterium]|nr:amino acid adenylation domain-containing protein [Pyrinomonadaceae bacterium]